MNDLWYMRNCELVRPSDSDNTHCCAFTVNVDWATARARVSFVPVDSSAQADKRCRYALSSF